jgi:pyridoxine 5-phosphate synthase
MTRLSVNLNKIALLRNSRHTGIPDVRRFAELVYSSGAHGITLHPRPDERHIRTSDVIQITERSRPWRPTFELNIEGYPDERFLDLVSEARPEQCTLVPDARDAFTSEKGWDLCGEQEGVVQPAIARLKELGCRTILFVDPDPAIVSKAAKCGADGIEIYTGSYAAAFAYNQGDRAFLESCSEIAREARSIGLAVNAGHDLNLRNLPALVAALPDLAEVSIGHELTADALVMGFQTAIGEYLRVLVKSPVF